MFREVLEAIKTICINDESECKDCPFNIRDSWHEYCLFGGPISHEGIVPDEWELDKIKWDSIRGESEVQNVND